MLSLNLLPPERKEMFYWRALTKNVVSWGIKILSIFFVFSLFSLVINLSLDYQVGILDKSIASYENTENVKEVKKIEESSKRINEILININKISEEQIYWGDALTDFIGIIPDNIRIHSMNIGLGGKFVIDGTAKTRGDLLIFEEKMRNAPKFNNIQLPEENLIEKEDVDFQLKGEFLLDSFRAVEKIKL